MYIVVKFTVVFYSGYNLYTRRVVEFLLPSMEYSSADACDTIFFFRNFCYLHCIEILKAPAMDAANVQGRSADSTAPDNSKRMEGNVPTRTVLKNEINLLNTDTDMHRVHNISSIIVYNNANASCDFCRPKIIFGGNRHFSTHEGNTVEHSSECFIHSLILLQEKHCIVAVDSRTNISKIRSRPKNILPSAILQQSRKLFPYARE